MSAASYCWSRSFTLAADTRKGMRAGFSTAADPATGARLFEYLVNKAQATSIRVATGRFGAHMQVSLVNDGPVTFWLESPHGMQSNELPAETAV